MRKKKESSWEVFRLRASAEYLGVVSAPDEGAALQRAIEAFAITAARQQKRAQWCGGREAPKPRGRTRRRPGLHSAKRRGRRARCHQSSTPKKIDPGATLRQTWQAVPQGRICRAPRKREATRLPRCGRPYTRDCAGLVGDFPCQPVLRIKRYIKVALKSPRTLNSVNPARWLLVPGERIELPTNGLQNRCSTAELTRRGSYDNAYRLCFHLSPAQGEGAAINDSPPH